MRFFSTLVVVSMLSAQGLTPVVYAAETDTGDTVQSIGSAATTTDETMDTSVSPGTSSDSGTDSTATSTETALGSDETSDVNGGAEDGGADRNDLSTSTTAVDHESATTTIDTGDATATADITSMVNTNTTAANGSATTQTDADNDAAIDTEATTTAQTGTNTVHGAEHAAIDTGNALSFVNVLNVANTNVVNSEGLITLLNAFDGQLGDLDLDQLAVFNGKKESVMADCLTQLCAQGSLASTADNTADLNSDITVTAVTGENEAQDITETAHIKTGDAVAAANVFNVANTNIVDSQYLLVAVNNIGDWDGNITLPGARDLMEVWGDAGLQSTPATLVSDNENIATTTTVIEAVTETGENEAEGEHVSVDSGDTTVMTNVVNQVNQNFIGGKSFMMLIKVHGDWNGSVLGLPENIAWTETDDGNILLYDKKGVLRSEGARPPLSAMQTNVASVDTRIKLIALTGKNKVDADKESFIETGDATALANTYNIVNTNVIGHNWFLGMFNIFGDWNGNVVFGRPDLWVGAKMFAPSGRIDHDDILEFTYTVINKGDQPAKNVRIVEPFDAENLRFLSSRNGVLQNGQVIWNLGTLAPGQAMDVSYRAAVQTTRFGTTVIKMTPQVVSDTKDRNETDNRDELDVVVENVPRKTPRIRLTNDPILIVQKDNNTRGRIAPGTTVDYSIKIENRGGPAYHAALLDTIVDQKGRVVYQQHWLLDTIAPAEEININYSVHFDENTRTGVYTNYAIVKAIGRNPSLQPMYGVFIDSNVAKSAIYISDKKYRKHRRLNQEPEERFGVGGAGNALDETNGNDGQQPQHRQTAGYYTEIKQYRPVELRAPRILPLED